MTEHENRRTSARVLLADARDRILLFRWSDGRWPNGHIWITPGGGIDGGEDVAAAALRELREETGYVLAPEALGPVVAVTSGPSTVGGRPGWASHSFFFVRVDDFVLDPSSQLAYERKMILGHYWWSADELATTTERVSPQGLGDLLPRLLAGDVPAEPHVLPWLPEPPGDGIRRFFRARWAGR